MNRRTLIILLFFISSWVCAEVPRDNSYTLQSAVTKYKKCYPDITAVEYNPATGSLRTADIAYGSESGRDLLLDVFSPPVTPDSPNPAVLLVHGGGWCSGSKELMHPLADYLAAHGFVAVTAEYRLSPEAQYPAAVNDLNRALGWMRNNAETYGIDTGRIAVLGGSAGAQLAGLIGMQDPSVSAIINIDGVMDFTCPEALQHENSTEKTDLRRPLVRRTLRRHFQCLERGVAALLHRRKSPTGSLSQQLPPSLPRRARRGHRQTERI